MKRAWAFVWGIGSVALSSGCTILTCEHGSICGGGEPPPEPADCGPDPHGGAGGAGQGGSAGGGTGASGGAAGGGSGGLGGSGGATGGAGGAGPSCSPACADGEDCVDGACKLVCVKSCECPEGDVCEGGHCEAPIPEPRPCLTDCDCPSGQLCVAGLCGPA